MTHTPKEILRDLIPTQTPRVREALNGIINHLNDDLTIKDATKLSMVLKIMNGVVAFDVCGLLDGCEEMAPKTWKRVS